MRWRVIKLAVIAVVPVALAMSSGCQKDDPREQNIPELSNIDRYGNPIADRPLSRMETDSLLVLKESLGITRDDYWLDFGGVLGTDYLEVWYPAGTITVAHGMYTFLYVADGRARAARWFGRVPAQMLTVSCSATLKEYSEKTGNEWWQYGLIEDDHITMQPAHILSQRGILDVAARHEYLVWALPQLAGGHSPRWLVTGLATYIAGEGFVLEQQWKEFGTEPARVGLKEMEKALQEQKDRKETRIATYNAYRMVRELIEAHGEEKMTELVNAMGDGKKFDAACGEVLGMSDEETVAQAQTWQEGAVD